MRVVGKTDDPSIDSLSISLASKKRKKANKNVGLNRTNARTAWVFLLPLFVVLFVFLALPIFNSLRLSVSKWPGVGPVKYVGAANYHRLVEQGNFFYSARITVIFAFSVAFLIIALAVILAAAVSSGIRGGKFMKVVWFFPGIAPPTAVAIFWSSSLQPDSGIVNIFLRNIGLGGNHALLGSERTALYPIIFVAVWASVGFAFLVILGATESVPVSIREAAIIDGANVRQQFTKITLPLIRPVVLTIFTLEIIWNFNGFTMVWAMTRGGPGVSTEILPIYAYKEAFFFGRFGTAALIAVVAGAFLILIGAIGTRLSRSAQVE
jgi:ABC-type sugar transport system permease subunit